MQDLKGKEGGEVVCECLRLSHLHQVPGCVQTGRHCQVIAGKAC